MSKRGDRERGRSRLALAGLILMVISFVFWELRPRVLPVPRRPRELAQGVIQKVVIDAGHGGQDSGAIRAGVQEKDLTLDVARRLDVLLRKSGLSTTLTRSADDTVSLAERASVANRERDCIFISIHFDEGGRAAATGVQTYYAVHQRPKTRLMPSWLPFLQQASFAPSNQESQSLAGFVQAALVSRTQAFDRGTRAEQFYVVANVRHPAVLVEGGFLSNNEDIGKLTNEGYRQQLALAISEGVRRYREVARAETEPDPPEDPMPE